MDANRAANRNHPRNGDVKEENGLRYVFSGGFWSLDQAVNAIDTFHTYSGRQAAKRPLRTAGSHLTVGTRLLRS